MNSQYSELREVVRQLIKKPRSGRLLAQLDQMVNFKVCPECGQRKPVGDFGKHAPSADGLRKHCNRCRSELRS